MTNKEFILDCLIQDDEAFTQIVDYFKFNNINISPLEIRRLLEEMLDEGYISINHSWKNECDEYPYSLTEKEKKSGKIFKTNRKYYMILGAENGF